MAGGNWSKEEVKLLLQLRADETIKEQMDGTCNNQRVYREIAERLGEWGVTKTATQVKNNLKYLRAKWQKVVTNNRSGREKKVDANEQLCIAIWGHRPSCTPVNVISSSASNIDNTNSNSLSNATATRDSDDDEDADSNEELENEDKLLDLDHDKDQDSYFEGASSPSGTTTSLTRSCSTTEEEADDHDEQKAHPSAGSGRFAF